MKKSLFLIKKSSPHLNKSQDNFSRILSGVKSYGTLAEFGLGALLKDFLPASQFIENVKMKDDTKKLPEFAIKLQDVLLPIDSHWPVGKNIKLLMTHIKKMIKMVKQKLEKI